MTPSMTEKDWSELKRLLKSHADRREALEEIQHKQDEASAFELQFKEALLSAESEEGRKGNKKGIAEVRKQQNLLFDHECLIRSDMLDSAKEMDYLLSKSFSYGLMSAFECAPFVSAVEMTIEAIYDSCDCNAFEVADKRGVIASALSQRYYRFLETYPSDNFKRYAAVAAFAESQGMPTRSAKIRLDQNLVSGIKVGMSLGLSDIDLKKLSIAQGLTSKQFLYLSGKAKTEIHFEEQIKQWAEAACDRMKRRDINQRPGDV